MSPNTLLALCGLALIGAPLVAATLTDPLPPPPPPQRSFAVESDKDDSPQGYNAEDTFLMEVNAKIDDSERHEYLNAFDLAQDMADALFMIEHPLAYHLDPRLRSQTLEKIEAFLNEKKYDLAKQLQASIEVSKQVSAKNWTRWVNYLSSNFANKLFDPKDEDVHFKRLNPRNDAKIADQLLRINDVADRNAFDAFARGAGLCNLVDYPANENGNVARSPPPSEEAAAEFVERKVLYLFDTVFARNMQQGQLHRGSALKLYRYMFEICRAARANPLPKEADSIFDIRQAQAELNAQLEEGREKEICGERTKTFDMIAQFDKVLTSTKLNAVADYGVRWTDLFSNFLMEMKQTYRLACKDKL